MKKSLFTFFLAFFALVLGAQEIKPVFSSSGNDVWYRIKFSAGSCVLQDMGADAKLLTQTNSSTNDAQLWKFVGTKSSFEIVGKSGRKIYYKDSRFYTGSTSYKFQLHSNSVSGTNSYFELQPATGSNGMNQWGGAGANKELGLYGLGDGNNKLSFVYASGQASFPTFSTEQNKVYYYALTRQGGYPIMASSNGGKVISSEVDQIDAQQWMFLGNENSFVMVDKTGKKLYYDETSQRYMASTTAEGTPMMFVQSNNVNTRGSLEIHRVSEGATGKGLGIVGSMGKNKELGENALSSILNAFSFSTYDSYGFVNYDYKTVAPLSYSPTNKATLWYTSPAKANGVTNPWMEYALPIGNGQFGGMVYGGIEKEEVQFNEKTLWTGSSTQRGAYQNFGSIFIENTDGKFGYGSDKAAVDYVRQLDLTNATASVFYKSIDKAVSYTREYIASNPDKVIAIRLKATEKGKISIKVSLKSAFSNDKTTYADATATFGNKLQTVTYRANLKVTTTGGETTTGTDGIAVTGADEVLIVLAGGTDFDPIKTSYVSNTANLISNMKARAADAAAKGWNQLYASHVADYQSLYNRMAIELDGTENNMTTEDLVKYYNTKAASYTDGKTKMLEMLYFNLGRYMMIGDSRGVDTPANLQGIWNSVSNPPWEADIHSNINVQECYWPAETTNLSECHLPFLNYIYDMACVQPQWTNYAKNTAKMSVGWTCFTQNNIFGHSNYAENYVIANAWYCSHLWQHYRYTLDKEYLKNTAIKPMISCAKFWIERLKLASDGTYECPNEWSPEHGPNENATAHSQQLVWDLFTNTLKAIDVLGISEAGVTQAWVDILKDKFAKLDTGLDTIKYTGKAANGIATGTTILREWKYTDDNTINDINWHRHQSHLMCLFPCNQISQSSPYFKAAVNSLQLRGDNSTGWSMGWRVNLWARALDGDHAHVLIHNALKHSTSYGTNEAAGGIYYNLFDSHAPFQIDGNFGTCAGMAEMLLQSHNDTILLLPALPAVWPSGKATGIKAVGNFTINQTWKNGKLLRAEIISNSGAPCAVSYAKIGNAKVYKNGEIVTFTKIKDDAISFNTEAGATYVLDLSGIGTGIGTDIVTEKKLSITNSGRQVKVNGNVKKVDVLDFNGRQLMTTTNANFTLPQNLGKNCIIKATSKDNSVTTEKVMVQ